MTCVRTVFQRSPPTEQRGAGKVYIFISVPNPNRIPVPWTLQSDCFGGVVQLKLWYRGSYSEVHVEKPSLRRVAERLETANARLAGRKADLLPIDRATLARPKYPENITTPSLIRRKQSHHNAAMSQPPVDTAKLSGDGPYYHLPPSAAANVEHIDQILRRKRKPRDGQKVC
jgi:hypothetical protein